MKIAVTGASGNLGTRVTRICIAHGHRVVGIDKVAPVTPPPIPDGASATEEWFKFIELDVREYDQVFEALRGCDAVIHLAAIPQPDYLVATHNLNVVASWNVLRASAELGIERISLASSINAIGMVWGDNPLIDYLPLDEKHPCRPEDCYSLSKLVAEMQADTIIRRWPNMRIASFRLSWAVPNREYAMGRPMEWVRKELWSWVDAEESARSFLLGVTSEVPEFKGHEAFFTVAPNTCQDELTPDLIKQEWPHVELRKEFRGREALFDCSKAERLLGWVHHDRSSIAADAPLVDVYPAEPAVEAVPTVEVEAVPAVKVDTAEAVAVVVAHEPDATITLAPELDVTGATPFHTPALSIHALPIDDSTLQEVLATEVEVAASDALPAVEPATVEVTPADDRPAELSANDTELEELVTAPVAPTETPAGTLEVPETSPSAEPISEAVPDEIEAVERPGVAVPLVVESAGEPSPEESSLSAEPVADLVASAVEVVIADEPEQELSAKPEVDSIAPSADVVVAEEPPLAVVNPVAPAVEDVIAEELEQSTPVAEAEEVPSSQGVTEPVVEGAAIQTLHELQPPTTTTLSTEAVSHSSENSEPGQLSPAESVDGDSSTLESVESSPEPVEDAAQGELEVIVVSHEAAIAPSSAPHDPIVTVVADDIVAKDHQLSSDAPHVVELTT